MRFRRSATIYQSRLQRVGGAVTGVVGGLLGISMLLEAERPGGRVFAVLFLATYVPVCIRFARARLVAQRDGVFIANVFSNRSFSWGEIERFEIGRWMLFPFVCLVRMRDGGVEHAFGIQERTNHPDESAETMVEELNEELARRSGEGR
jgi:hypothetical protein